MAGALLAKLSLPAAMQLAADFVVTAIEATFAAGTPIREGVLLESVLPWLGQERAGRRRELVLKPKNPRPLGRRVAKKIQ
ncbi:hypothetical protein [Sporomusa termitida]|uniref:Uncharacterized protein n=1 Tax=Sporomusa termitida TaxID=2377 RepID=A0A517DXZ8_9FIRM|nr:hypothetical protein [Sporomusa termitida]QDR82229.1 hypothetical protein SPTER_36530 [Sporomusa termitida]